MKVPARKYNPGFLTDEELVASFCVRTTEFGLLIEALRECVGNSNLHQLVIGQRGSGKTCLLLRVAAELRRDPRLAADFLPIVFAEESYEIATAGEFWLACLTHCATQVPRAEGGVDLEHTVAELRNVRDDRMLAERCLGTLLDIADREDRRLVLLVENMDMLFRDMSDVDAGWRLRKVLQTEPRIVMLGSAISRFDEIDRPDRAMYELFRVRTLRPLNTDECAVLWQSVAGRPVRLETIRSLQILTGGSPRLLAIVARFGASRSFTDLMADLLDLVDDHTEYFKSHLESLPAQERRVYLALATLWRPATAREVADGARLDTSACSAQLARLSKRGAVEIAGGSARRKEYYLSERLYNIYYLLRRGRGPARLVEALVRFMESFYSPPELAEIAVRELGRGTSLMVGVTPPSPAARRPSTESSVAVDALRQSALEELVASPALDSFRDEFGAVADQGAGEQTDDQHPPDEPEVVAATEACKRIDELVAADRRRDALAVCEQVALRFGESNSPAVLDLVAKASVGRGSLLYMLERPQDALAALSEVVERFWKNENPAVWESVATALFHRGVILAELGQPEAALAAYDAEVDRFGDSDLPSVLVQVGKALLNKGQVLGDLGRLRSAVAVYDDVIRRFGDNHPPVESVALALSNKGLALFTLERPREALATCDETIRRFGESETPEVLDSVATALITKGWILEAQDRPNDALAVYDDVIRRLGGSGSIHAGSVAVALLSKARALLSLHRPHDALTASDEVVQRFSGDWAADPVVPAACVHSLVVKGTALGEMGRREEALAVFDDVIARFGDDENGRFHEQVAAALLNKEVELRSSRPKEALVSCDEVIRRFGNSEDPTLMKSVATALVRRSSALYDLKRPADALMTCDEVVGRFGDRKEPALLTLVAEALENKVLALEMLSRREDTLAVFDDIVRRFEDGRIPSLLVPVARALVHKASMLSALGRQEEQLVVCDEVVRRFGESDVPPLIESVAEALHLKVRALAALGRPDEVLVAADEITRRFEHSASMPLLDPVADALLCRGVALGELNLLQDAIATFDAAFGRFGESKSPIAMQAAANALMNKGVTLARLHRTEDAVAVYDDVNRRFGKSKIPVLRLIAAKALVTKGAELAELGRVQDALTTCDEAVRQFGTTDNVPVLESVVYALLNKGSGLRKLKRSQEAVAVYDELLGRFGEHDAPTIRRGVNEALLAKAHVEYDNGLYAAAAATAGRVTEGAHGASPEQRLRGHAVQASARLKRGGWTPTERDVKTVLALLTQSDAGRTTDVACEGGSVVWRRLGKEPGTSPPVGEAVSTLLAFSVDLGVRRILDLIGASPSGRLLSPLVTALEWELGETPRVAREIDEVAHDIQRVLRTLKRESDPPHHERAPEVNRSVQTNPVIESVD